MNWRNKAQDDRSRNFRVLRLTSLTYTDMRSDLTDSRASVTSDIQLAEAEKIGQTLRNNIRTKKCPCPYQPSVIFDCTYSVFEKKNTLKSTTLPLYYLNSYLVGI